MPPFKDLTSKTFGRLTVQNYAGSSKHGRKHGESRWMCLCSCGSIIETNGTSLTRGSTKSCGCLRKELKVARMLKDLTGQTFGRLTVISRNNQQSPVMWLCLCSCGNQTIARSGHLRTGDVKSCGCLQGENGSKQGKLTLTHGHSVGRRLSRTYSSWAGAIQRCTNSNAPRWECYGGRGITICDRWRNSFEAFLEDMGERLPNTTIGRINGNLGYFPGNVAWQTVKEQADERKSRHMEAA